jgi:DNA-binding transcriptional LysR family regulator
MNDLEIRYFLEIVNNGVSFTKTANALYVSQPALTKHMKKLGEELGVKLFDTSKKNAICLTSAGRRYYQFFSETSNRFKLVMDEVKALKEQEHGEVCIASLANWDMLADLPTKNAFCEIYPNITISITSLGFRAIKNGILNNQYDMAVTISDQFRGIPNICIHDYNRISRVLLFSSQHRLSGLNVLSIRDFKDDILYTLTEEEAPFLRQINEDYCKSKGFIPKIKTLPNLESIFLALQTGEGYTIIDNWTWERNNANFKSLQLDTFFTVSGVWKKDNANWALQTFLKTCFLNQEIIAPQ